MKKTIIYFVIVLLICCATSFYAGTKYSKKDLKNNLKNFEQMQEKTGLNQQTGQKMMKSGQGNSLSGEVLSKDDKTVTVKLYPSGSKIIFLSDKTKVMKSVEGTLADLNIGMNIMVTGTSTTDGNFTVETIQIR